MMVYGCTYLGDGLVFLFQALMPRVYFNYNYFILEVEYYN